MSLLERIFLPQSLRDYMDDFKPSPSIESFANNFVAQSEPTLGGSVSLQNWDYDPDRGILVYELPMGKTLKVGIERVEGKYPEAIIGVK